jgi:hypothetical protein
MGDGNASMNGKPERCLGWRGDGAATREGPDRGGGQGGARPGRQPGRSLTGAATMDGGVGQGALGMGLTRGYEVALTD